MNLPDRWTKEPGTRVTGSRALDSAKLQAPCITRNPAGGFRLFYTAVGPGKPYANCQGYILSAVSDDGLRFRPEPGIRLAPQPGLPHMSRRVLVPTVTACGEGRWRMYFESRGPADCPTVICSAVSADMLNWEHEGGVRFRAAQSVRGPRFVRLPDGRGRLYCLAGDELASAVSANGLDFECEPACRFTRAHVEFASAGITAAEVVVPADSDGTYGMVFSEWEDVPPGTVVPLHPSDDPDADTNGGSAGFAAASIAADMAGYRSRIYTASSADGLLWERGTCIVEGGGYEAEGPDAVHAEDMSLLDLGGGRYRMYYAACDRHGRWTIASAVGGANN